MQLASPRYASSPDGFVVAHDARHESCWPQALTHSSSSTHAGLSRQVASWLAQSVCTAHALQSARSLTPAQLEPPAWPPAPPGPGPAPPLVLLVTAPVALESSPHALASKAETKQNAINRPMARTVVMGVPLYSEAG